MKQTYLEYDFLVNEENWGWLTQVEKNVVRETQTSSLLLDYM